jgi:hypothetical protein
MPVYVWKYYAASETIASTRAQAYPDADVRTGEENPVLHGCLQHEAPRGKEQRVLGLHRKLVRLCLRVEHRRRYVAATRAVRGRD